MTNGTLVAQEYWDRSYERVKPSMAPEGDPVRQWIESNVPATDKEAHALEIGCYPGRYLAVIGRLGYTCHGIDLTPGVTSLPDAFVEMGLRPGTFTRTDFQDLGPGRTYDIVCSFGFIEHFRDWREVLRAHGRLVAPGGLLLIETPNFRGPVHGLLHRLLDGENLARHEQAAMHPDRWAEVLRGEGFEVLWAGWFGRFEFWHDSPRTGVLHRIGLRAVGLLTPLLRGLGSRSEVLSPYCGLVARKR